MLILHPCFKSSNQTPGSPVVSFDQQRALRVHQIRVGDPNYFGMQIRPAQLSPRWMSQFPATIPRHPTFPAGFTGWPILPGPHCFSDDERAGLVAMPFPATPVQGAALAGSWRVLPGGAPAPFPHTPGSSFDMTLFD